jgi:acyl carrier protein
MLKHDIQLQVEERVFAALAEFGADPDRLSRDATFEELDIDSLDLVELTQIVEEECGVRLEAQRLEGLKTVGQAVDVVLQLLP